jgi:hypothetical protein
MSRRESMLLIIVLTAVFSTAALVVYQKVYYPRICEARVSVKKSDVAVLVDELQSLHACVRSAAALDLQQIGKSGELAIPYLVKTAEDKDDSVRWRSVAALGHIGVARPEIKETALRHLKDSSQTAVYNSVFTLTNYPSHEAVEGLMSVLNHPWENVRFRAAQDVAWMVDKERDKDLLPELTKRLQALQTDSSAQVRSRASLSLAQVQGGGSKPAEGRNVEANQIEKEFLVNEFDHLISAKQPGLRSAAVASKPARDLAGQYEELEKGLSLLKSSPAGADAEQFLCWVKKDLNRYRFRSIVFKEDFQELQSFLAKTKKQSECAAGAAEVVNEILSSKDYDDVAFECPRVSSF